MPAILLITWAAAQAGPFPFQEADEAFNSGNLPQAESMYQSIVAATQTQPLPLARALEGLAAIYLTRGQDALFRSTMAEVVRLRRSQPLAQPDSVDPSQLLAETGLERGLVPPWGTGHYESGHFNFGIWWNSSTCRSFAKMDSSQSHSGQSSLRLSNFTPVGPHLFGTTSQRIRAVSPNTNYEISLWAKADSLSPGAVQIIVDAGWLLRPLTLPPGTYDWKPFKAQFNSGDLAQIDFRVVMQNQGTVWLDDLSLRRLQENEPTESPLLQASAAYRRGRVREALELCRGLEKSWADQPQKLSAVWTLMAEALAMLGQYRQAVELYEKVKGPNSFPIWMALGEIYLKLGQPTRALECYRHVYQRVTLDQATTALAADGIARALLELGDLREATSYEGQSLGIMTHINDPHGRATGLCHLAEIYARASRLEAAREALESALPLARTLGDRQLESDILTRRGRLQSLPSSALADLSEAVRLRREIFDRYGLLESLYWLGHTQAQQGARQAAIACLREAAEVLESLQQAAGSLSEGGAGLLNSDVIYEELIRLYLETGQREEALELLGRSRNRQLCQVFNKQGATLAHKQQEVVNTHLAMQADRVALEKTLQRELSRPLPQQDPTTIAEARQQREKNLSDYREFLRNLFQTQPELAGLISVHPKQLRLKQSQLPPDGAIVEYLSGEKQLFIFVVTRSVLEVRVVDLPRQVLIRRVNSLRQQIATTVNRQTNASALLAESHQLYRDLLGPVEGLLSGIHTLSILPNGPLHYLPFQALVVDPNRQEYLVDRMACANLCEESFLSAPAQPKPPKKILLLGNPDGSLVHSEDEVRSIAKIYPGSQAYVGKSARKSLLHSAGQKYQGLHIASHGYLDSRDASRSFILLAPDGADPEQGRLSLREVWGLDLKGLDLVTLSACVTGLGEQSPGDEVISLENAFFFAGASSVAASLWDVSDQTTARLMTEFYRNLTSDGAVRALQRAQLTLKKEYPQPYYWAPFILVAPP